MECCWEGECADASSSEETSSTSPSGWFLREIDSSRDAPFILFCLFSKSVEYLACRMSSRVGA